MHVRTTPPVFGVRKRLAILTSVALVTTATAVIGNAPGASASPDPAQVFRKAPAGSSVVAKLPAVNGLVTAVVEVAGDPVTVAGADTPMTGDQKQQRKNELKLAQAPIEQRVRELGGTVLGSYQSAYNGVRVRIPAASVPALVAVPGVVDVHPAQLVKPDNVRGVPFIGAPAVWAGAAGFRGESMKIAVIDTGIDYTHADFGGPGTVEAYETAKAAETAPANPAWFGPGALKVKGGVDFVGDKYNADPNAADFQPVPHADSNPLDCQGHGSHVAGSAAGFGVTADGKTYAGSYDASTIASREWTIAPGVAPKADLYALRVFGCTGSTDIVIDAIEWAVDHGMDVINMSLGSSLAADPAGAAAASNAAKAGVIVVASAGNAGPAPYITSSPASGTNTISVAASDPVPGFPGATLTLSTGASVEAAVTNGAALTNPTLPVKVLRTGAGISLGCDPAEYNVPGVAGALVVVKRGTCARVARAVYGQKAGAAAVVMVNSVDSLPPFEGPITEHPETGEKYVVTIPFMGVPSSATAAFLAADGGTVAIAGRLIVNPGFGKLASFSSAGPRSGDSWLKPDVTAPGVSTVSVGVGTGNGFATLSGTSMSAPHTAGMAALVKQAHPGWGGAQYWKAAIVNTSDPAKVVGYATRGAGAGLIQAPPAVTTQVVALGDPGTATLNYGFAEIDKTFNAKKKVTLKNFDSAPATLNVSIDRKAGSPHTVKIKPTKVTVPARGSATVEVELTVPVATAGDSSAFNDVAGLVTFTPATPADNKGVTLRVPYYLVPQAVSDIDAHIDLGKLRREGTTPVKLVNRGAVTGAADFYAWGLSDSRDRQSNSADLRAVGVKTIPGGIAFAISTYHRWSNASSNTFVVHVDVNGDKVDDYQVVGADFGALTSGNTDGEFAVAVYDLRTGEPTIEGLADAPFDSSTVALPVTFEQLCAAGSPCLSAANPRLTYHVESVGVAKDGTALRDEIDGAASFNAFAPSITTGIRSVVAPGATKVETVNVNPTEWKQTPNQGLMIVTNDNRSGGDDAQLIRVILS